MSAITNHQSQVPNRQSAIDNRQFPTLQSPITNCQGFHRESRIRINRAAHTPPHRISAVAGGKVNKSSGLEHQQSTIANRNCPIGNRRSAIDNRQFPTPQSPITDRPCFHRESRIAMNRAAHTPPHRISAVPGGKVNKSSDLEYQQSPIANARITNRNCPIGNRQ
jgi:hypothetical protein